jgi:chromosome segregation ATPase
MKTIEESREGLANKNSALQREMLSTSRKYADKIVSVEDQINQLRDERAEGESALTDVKGTVDLLSVDLKKHSHEHDTTIEEKEAAQKHMVEKKDGHKSQLEKLLSEQADEQRRFKFVQDAAASKKSRLEGKLEKTSSDLKHIRDEH